MNPAGDFEIINVLNSSSKSDLYLVRKIATDELLVWRTIIFKTMPKDKKECLFKRIRKRIQQNHVLLVKFFPAIEEDKLKLVYVPMEYFQHGSLSDFLKVLKKSDTTHIPQEIMVKILFQLLILVKSVELTDHIKLGNIYFDEEFNIKFTNFSYSAVQMKADVRICDIGILMMQLCSFTIEKMCNNFIVSKEYYSEEFIDLMEFMLKDNTSAILSVDKIICHPVIVLNTFKLSCGVKLKGCFELLDLRKKLEQLRKKESGLKLREVKIKEKEMNLSIKEKKLLMYGKAVEDKLTRANSSLKRCRENKNGQPVNKYENVDSSVTVEYEEIEDLDIETSEKIDFNKLKHQPIARTLSERKGKFKGHSPLKKNLFHKTKQSRKSKDREKKFKKRLDEKSASKNTETHSHITESEDKKQMIFEYDLTKMENLQISNIQCRPITWTEENKKQAFELLRIMNSNLDVQFCNSGVQHTFL